MIRHGYLETEKECACVAANHEIDMEMMSGTYIKYLPELVKEGRVTQETIDSMLRRVLELKEKLGLLDNPYIGVDYESAKAMELSEEHRALARKAAEKSMVLLKNEGVLPFSFETNVAFVGPYVAEQDIIGQWKCFGKIEESVSVKMGVEALLGKEVTYAKGCEWDLLTDDLNNISEAVEVAKDADAIVVCIGEPSYEAGEGASRADISIPKAQVELVRALNKLNKPIVLVVFGGRPQVLTEVEPMADAILYAWQPGNEGGNAIANVLYGKSNPSAKTTMSFPRTTGQCPIFYNYFSTGRPKKIDDLAHSRYNSSYRDVINAPLYPFGYGLSYTEFKLSDMQVSTDIMKVGDTITASIMLENVGTCDGEEVVQLYIRDYFASMVRPVKEMKDYRKIALKAGEKARVEFTITEETLKFFDENRQFVAEPGKFAVMIGNSSANVETKDIELVI
jgi:beta-glucosidase